MDCDGFVFAGFSADTTRWSGDVLVCDAGTVLEHHCFDVSCLLGHWSITGAHCMHSVEQSMILCMFHYNCTIMICLSLCGLCSYACCF